MKLARHDRSLIAWMLYASVLFSLFACGLHHGQMSGMALSGLGGGYCSVTDGGGAGVDLGGADQTTHTVAQFSCPLCSSFALAVAINTAGWLLAYVPAQRMAPVVVRSWAQAPPRHSWPSLNPRASPAISS